KQVFDRLVALHGRDPQAEISPDMARALLEHINDRVRFICQNWRWPEWELTEERAFRQVWNADHQYLKASVLDGKPDEVFYIPDMLYHRVLASAGGDPPVGTLPTDTTYWETISPVDTFIAYDQGCRRAIGMVLGTYMGNPRVPTGYGGGRLQYLPSERGIDVRGTGPTVFVTYKMPVPSYTIIPYVVGKNYLKGDIVFDPTVGECFQALAGTTALPADTNVWRRVPFLEAWKNYVCQGAFADSLMEFDQGSNGEVQAKVVLAQYANSRADEYYQMEVDALVAQGQKLTWNFCPRYNVWYDSQPWSGGTVSTLTDVCEDELGWIYPTPTTVPQVSWQYRNEIVALRAADGTPALDEVATRNYFVGSIVQIVIIESGLRTLMQWELVAG